MSRKQNPELIIAEMTKYYDDNPESGDAYCAPLIRYWRDRGEAFTFSGHLHIPSKKLRDLFFHPIWKVRTRREWWKIFCDNIKKSTLVRGWFLPEHAAAFIGNDRETLNNVLDGFNPRGLYDDSSSMIKAINNWDMYLCSIYNPDKLWAGEIQDCIGPLFVQLSKEDIQILYSNWVSHVSKGAQIGFTKERKVEFKFQGKTHIVGREKIYHD